MTDGLFELPEKPFFSCDDDGFAIADGALMRSGAGLLSVEPLLHLKVGEGNVFEQRPRKVSSWEGRIVEIECDDGTTIVLDFDAMAARKRTADGEFIYRGDLEDGNGGKGFIKAR